MASAPAAVITSRSPPIIASCDAVTVTEVLRILNTVPSKHCDLDPIPTWLVKKAAGVHAPVICTMCNSSVQSGVLPKSQKHAIIRPRLKKPGLDATRHDSYRPISNLSFISKLIERVVAARYVKHAEDNQLFPARQSAYRRFHSTDTAVAVVPNDLVRAADAGHVTGLVLLDLSSAFDTVDHSLLLSILRSGFGVDGLALRWFQSYLSERTQTFVVNGTQSSTFHVDCSVPQGSVLGPLQFISYTDDVTSAFDQHDRAIFVLELILVFVFILF